MKKKIIAAVLICSIMLSVFAVPSSAVAAETLIIGGVLASFLASCGVAIMAPNSNPDKLVTILYDQWKKQNDEWLEDVRISDTEFLSLVHAKDNKLVISNKLSRALSNFTEANSNQQLAGGITVDGQSVNIPFIPLDATQIKYNPVYNSSSVISYDGNTYTCTYTATNTYAEYVFYKTGQAAYIIGTDKVNFTSYRNSALSFEDRYMLFITQEPSSGEYRIGTITDRSQHTAMYAQSYDYRLRYRYSYPFGRYWVPDIAVLSEKLTLPTDTLEDDQNTVIEIPGVVGETVSDIATQAMEKAEAGTLTATYTNNNPIPPIPETNLSWVRSLHSIWEYVEYLIDQASAGFSFFSGLLAALPVEVEFCFYGALVLLLFGGVISRLLL